MGVCTCPAVTCAWQTPPRAPPLLQRADISQKPLGACLCWPLVSLTPQSPSGRHQRGARGYFWVLSPCWWHPRASQEVSLCNSALVGLFLYLQAHSFTAEGDGNLSRTGLENKPSIALRAQLGQAGPSEGIKVGPKVAKLPDMGEVSRKSHELEVRLEWYLIPIVANVTITQNVPMAQNVTVT